jgi:demethylmenaquinone methyltransferase/2-methoxy-6-polyprenyl-1,4-benzoquinol methylase
MPDYTHRPLNKIFTRVTPRYDLINRLFTLRLDERWRKKATRAILRDNPSKVLDLCTGTGDLAVMIARMCGNKPEITGYDYSQPMLELATVKAARKKAQNIVFMHGDAAAMPFPDKYFDAIGIAFAFRNLTFRNPDAEAFLDEIFRVLKPGGRFVVVESSQPKNSFVRAAFRLYTRYMVLLMGAVLSKNKPAYQYLAYSVIHFYKPEEIEDLLRQRGFSSASHQSLFLGAAAIHVAVK